MSTLGAIGVISDTHGLVRPEVFSAFRGVRLILHAGDIGDTWVLEALGAISPVVAVRGNNDTGSWAEALPERRAVEIDGMRFHLLHDVTELDLDPAAAGFDAVISGHSHRSSIEKKKGIYFINPGSAGPRRFKLPVSIGFIRIEKSGMSVELQEL